MPVYVKPCPECDTTLIKKGFARYRCVPCHLDYQGHEVEVSQAYKNTNRGRSNKHENKTAVLMGGRVTVGSGSFDFDKADVVTEDMRIECKTTLKRSKSVSLHLMHKIRKETEHSKMAVLGIQFELPNNHTERYYTVDENTFLMLLEAYRYHEKHKND